MMMATAEKTFQLPFLKEPGVQMTFDNGHTFVFVPRKGQVFNVSTWVKTGSMNEDAQNNGVSHFLEHLMFKGTARCKPGEFDKAMENMGAIINAATWKDYTFYYVTGPNTDYGEFDTALDLHADMLLHSTLPEEEIGEPYDPAKGEEPPVKRERGVVIEEIGMCEDRPWNKIYNAVNAMMYPEGHPYRRDVIGTRTIVGTIPREQIEAYYRRWYSPENMTTIVVGDFDKATVVEKVQKAFDFASRTDATPALARYTEPTPAETFKGQFVTDPKATRYETIVSDVNTQFFSMAFAGPPVEDQAATVGMNIASTILGESLSSRFNQNLVEKQTPSGFNMLGTGQYEFKLGNVVFIQGNFNTTDVTAALDEVKAELIAFLTGKPITQEEFDRIIKKARVDFASGIETTSGIADVLGESLTVNGTVEVFTHWLDVLNALTLEGVQAVAKKYLQPELAFTAVLGSATALKEQSTASKTPALAVV
ncbi:MAG: insulinase family protein [Vampirovibrio sp.]|nr:insulinase family protein [Vampirovibrio sp.]